MSSLCLNLVLIKYSYDRFFDVFLPIMPMLSRTRFETEISQVSPTIGTQALSYAIAALGSFSVPELRCYVERCYENSRCLLDMCERQESGESLASINTLQACILLTLYEFKQPNFARAWMTLGRAIRLAKMMGLDQADGHANMAAQWGLRAQLPRPINPVDAEEWRRTFWVLYVFDGFSSLRTDSGSAFGKQVRQGVTSPLF